MKTKISDGSQQIIDNEYKIKILFRLINRIYSANPHLVSVSPTEFETIKQEILSEIREKYPNDEVILV